MGYTLISVISFIWKNIDLVVSDSDYGYQIKSKDRLGRPFGYLEFIFSAIVDPSVFRVMSSEAARSNIIGGIYLSLSVFIYLLDSMYYDKRSSFAKLWSELFGSSTCILLAFAANLSIKKQVLTLILLLLIPLTWRISEEIIVWNNHKVLDCLQFCG